MVQGGIGTTGLKCTFAWSFSFNILSTAKLRSNSTSEAPTLTLAPSVSFDKTPRVLKTSMSIRVLRAAEAEVSPEPGPDPENPTPQTLKPKKLKPQEP